jgi:hypothetical protein
VDKVEFSRGQGPPVRADVSGFSPRQRPRILPQHPQQLPVANGDKAGCVAGIPDKSASRAKRAGDFVAQREFIRNGTRNAGSLVTARMLRRCGIFRSRPDAGNLISPGLRCRSLQIRVGKFFSRRS